MPSGTIGAWIMAYAKARAVHKTQERKEYAAWRMRMEGDDTERWMRYKWKHYKMWVKKGFKPVRQKVREQWCSELLQMTHNMEMMSKGTDRPIKIKYMENGNHIVTGGDERTQRKVARCIGGTPASRVRITKEEAGEMSSTTKDRKMSTIMWRRVRVKSEVLDKMRTEIHKARMGMMEEEMAEYENRYDEMEDTDVHPQEEGVTMEEGEPKLYEDDLEDEWARTIN